MQFFAAKEVEKLRDILKFHPDGHIFRKTIEDLMDLQDLSNNLNYPMNSISDLERQLGTDKTISVGEKSIKISDIGSQIPAYYFPIASEKDFFSKASELMNAVSSLGPVIGAVLG